MDLIGRREDLQDRNQCPCFHIVDLQKPLLELVVDQHLDIKNPHGCGFFCFFGFVGDIGRCGPSDYQVGATHEDKLSRLQSIDALFEAQVILRCNSRRLRRLGDRRDQTDYARPAISPGAPARGPSRERVVALAE